MREKMKNYISAAGITAVLLLVVCLRVTPSFGDVDSEKESLNQMQNEKSNAEEILKQLEADKQDSQKYIDELDAVVEDIANRIYEIQQQIDTKVQEISQTEEVIAKTEVEITEQYESMKLRIQYMYENGNASYLAMILDSKSIGEFLNRAEYISELTAYDRDMMKVLQAKKSENEAAKASLTSQLAALEQLQADAEAERAATETLMAAKSAEIESYNASISEAENKISSLDDDIEAQQALVKEMESIEARRKAEEESRKKAEEESRRLAEEAAKAAGKETEATTAAQSTSNGKFVWPIAGISKISSYFGYRDNPFGTGGTEYHNGIDIPASTGTPIMAVSGGQVAWSYHSSSAGNWVGIDHGNGIYSVYMHMSTRKVEEGDYVTAGQVIGLVGSTGRSTGPHLHLGIRVNGSYVDPLKYVSP